MESKNTGLIVSLIVLSLLVVGLGGYVVYDKVLSDKPIENNDDKKDDNEVENNKVDNNEVVNSETNNTNSYELFAKTLKGQFSKYSSNNRSYQFVKNAIVNDGYSVYLSENQSLYVKYFNNELNAKYGEYKIADNVLSFYVVAVGQDAGNMVYFINEDGTVGSASTEYGVSDSNQIKVEKDLGYKNIVSVIGGSFSDGLSSVKSPIFIDINGNIFSANLK